MRDLKVVKGDIFGGITAGIVALPLALAFGVQSGLGAVYGMYGAIFLGFIAAVLGGTRMQVSGPTGPMTVLTATFIAEAIAQFGSVKQASTYIVLTFVLVGIFQILFGAIRLGDFVKYIPYPVISGFMTGIGVIIILLQIYPALGHAAPLKIIDVFHNIREPLSQMNSDALALSVSTILLIYMVPKITRMIPSTLVALVMMTLMAKILNMQVPLIGTIPYAFPKIHWEIFSFQSLSLIFLAWVPAMTLAAVGAIDSLLTSVVADNMTKTSHRSNQELLGQGIGNAISGLFMGLPGAGATMRTAVNIQSGGTTRLSGILHSLVLLIILMGAGKYASQIPLSVLAGILITVGIGIIDYRGFRCLCSIPKPEAAIMLLVILLTVFVNLLHAVGIGIMMASILFMKKMTEISESNSTIAPLNFDKDLPWYDEATIPLALKNYVYVKHLEGPLFFAFKTHFQSLVNEIPDIKVVIIRMGRVPYIDQTGFFALEDACTYLKKKKILVVLSGLQQQPSDMLAQMNFFENTLAKRYCFEFFPDTIYFLEKQASQKLGVFKE